MRKKRESACSETPPGEGGAKGSTARPLALPIEPTSTDAQVLKAVCDHYSTSLQANPAVLEYLAKRRISADAIEAFTLGFSDRSLGLQLPMGNRSAGALVRERLRKVGILKESGHEIFRGALTIPLTDEAGNIVQVYGRMVSSRLRPEIPKHLWLPGVRQGLINRVAITSKTVIVTASLIDALSCWSHGFQNVTAIHGLDGPTDEFLAAVFQGHVEQVVIAFRNNPTGLSAAHQLSVRLEALGIQASKALLPMDKDVSDLVRHSEDPGKELAEVLTVPEAKVTPTLSLVAQPAQPEASICRSGPESAPAAHDPSVPTLAAIDSDGDEVVIVQGDRRYRVRGLAKNLSRNVLKVNLLVSRDEGAAFHVDSLDLYLARQRHAFVKQASIELGVEEEFLKREVGRVLMKCEEQQEELIRQALAPPPPSYTMSEAEKQEALAFLTDPALLDRILADFETCGLVGEADNKLVGYLAAVSRKDESPIAILVQSSSAAGKTTLLDAVLGFVPPEDRVQLSAMTSQSLYYLPPDALTHKVLALAEQEGGSKASYALKLLQSEGALSIATTAKESGTGRLRTEQYEVKGPVSIFTSTTAADLDPELVNRCVVLVADESSVQTHAIHEAQKVSQTVEGLQRQRERERITALHWNAQRLLRPVKVLNPFAHLLTFPDSRTRLRRDFTKYLGLIRAVALLRQHQRAVKTVTSGKESLEYVEVIAADIAVANRLAHRVLGRALDDLPPQTRKLLTLIDSLVKSHGIERLDYRFTQRKLREAIGWGQTQTKIHLKRLVDLELLVAHRGKGQFTEYQVLFDGNPESQEPHLPGLIDPSKLQPYEAQRSGQIEVRSGVGRPLVGPESGGGRIGETAEKPSNGDGFGGAAENQAEIENKEPDFRVNNRHTDIADALLAATEEGR